MCPRNSQSINVTSQGVEGVDLPAGGFSFQIRKCFPPGTITDEYVAAVASLSNPPHLNKEEFYGFPVRAVRFDGATGSTRGDGADEITFDFSVADTETDIEIRDKEGNPVITIPLKEGWDLLWTEYEQEPDAAANSMATRAKAAYVERVYPEGDFTVLGV